MIALPRNHMAIYQMCDMSRGAAEMRMFTQKYDQVAKYKRWTAFGSGNKTQISAQRFFGVYNIGNDVLQQVTAAQEVEATHKQAADAARQQAKRAQDLAARAKLKWQNALEQSAGWIP